MNSALTRTKCLSMTTYDVVLTLQSVSSNYRYYTGTARRLVAQLPSKVKSKLPSKVKKSNIYKNKLIGTQWVM